MARDLNVPFGPKRVEIVVLGAPVAPERATEIIRRTDLGFRKLRFPLSDYGQQVRRLVGFPSKETDPAILQWRRQWGAIDLEWLANSQLLHGKGWCHPDGTIALIDELEDYPWISELREDCRRLATAFPDLSMYVAAWGSGQTILGFPFIDAPESPWPTSLLNSQSTPTLGFWISGGAVQAMEGADPLLFHHLGLHHSQAVEKALGEMRRCANLSVTETCFGNRRYARGLPDAVVQKWIAQARSLGLNDEAQR